MEGMRGGVPTSLRLGRSLSPYMLCSLEVNVCEYTPVIVFLPELRAQPLAILTGQ